MQNTERPENMTQFLHCSQIGSENQYKTGEEGEGLWAASYGEEMVWHLEEALPVGEGERQGLVAGGAGEGGPSSPSLCVPLLELS